MQPGANEHRLMQFEMLSTSRHSSRLSTGKRSAGAQTRGRASMGKTAESCKTEISEASSVEGMHRDRSVRRPVSATPWSEVPFGSSEVPA